MQTHANACKHVQKQCNNSNKYSNIKQHIAKHTKCPIICNNKLICIPSHQQSPASHDRIGHELPIGSTQKPDNAKHTQQRNQTNAYRSRGHPHSKAKFYLCSAVPNNNTPQNQQITRSPSFQSQTLHTTMQSNSGLQQR